MFSMLVVLQDFECHQNCNEEKKSATFRRMLVTKQVTIPTDFQSNSM